MSGHGTLHHVELWVPDLGRAVLVAAAIGGEARHRPKALVASFMSTRPLVELHMYIRRHWYRRAISVCFFEHDGQGHRFAPEPREGLQDD